MKNVDDMKKKYMNVAALQQQYLEGAW